MNTDVKLITLRIGDKEDKNDFFDRCQQKAIDLNSKYLNFQGDHCHIQINKLPYEYKSILDR